MTLSSASITSRRELRVRIGVVLDGTLVEERIVGQDVVTVGQSAKNTLCLPFEGAPRAWPLLRRVDGEYLLSLSSEMDGRLSLGDGVRTFDELRSAHRPVRGSWTLPVGKGARGKLRLGDATILFQLIEVPLQPRPTLPKSIRGGLGQRLDPLLLAIVAVSVIAHGGFAYWLYQRDVPTRTALERIAEGEPPRAERRVAIVVPAELVPDPTPRAGVDVRVPGDTDTPQRDRPRGERLRVTDGSGAQRELDDARIRELVDGSAAIAVLSGGSDERSRYGRMSGKDPGADLDRALKHVANSGQPIVTQRPDGLRARDGGDRDIHRGEHPVVDGPDGADVPVAKRERELPPPKLEEVEPLEPDGVAPEVIAGIIRRRYVRGVHRCHSDLLRVDATAGGRVDLQFTVSRVGAVVQARASGFDERLDQCVEGLARRWRFPVAKSDGVAIEASYATTFMLKAP